MRHFEDDHEMQMLRTSAGAMEVAWPAIKDIRPVTQTDRILAQKFTAYVYNRVALDYLVNINSKGLIALCIRDPIRALVSWHNMHRSIAKSGKNPDHFGWKERDFYTNRSISDYYEKFAKSRLQYDKHLLSTLEAVPKDRFVVISQERMAQDIVGVANYLKALVGWEQRVAPEPYANPSQGHQGFADKVDIDIDDEIINELRGVKDRLAAIVAVTWSINAPDFC